MLEKFLLPAKVLRVVIVRLWRGGAVHPRVFHGLNQSIYAETSPHCRDKWDIQGDQAGTG